MLPNLTCPDVFDNNGPHVLSQVKVQAPPQHDVAHAALPVQGAGTCLLLTLYSHSKLHGKLVLIMCVYVQLSGDYTTSPLKAGTYYFACQVPGHW